MTVNADIVIWSLAMRCVIKSPVESKMKEPETARRCTISSHKLTRLIESLDFLNPLKLAYSASIIGHVFIIRSHRWNDVSSCRSPAINVFWITISCIAFVQLNAQLVQGQGKTLYCCINYL